MIIKILVDDTTQTKDFQTEHGLSLYIETQDKKILFDSGASGLFFENAVKMDIDISDIDYAVISHGHNDHGGGLGRFLEENSKAEVFLHDSAFGKHYSMREDRMVNIGLDQSLKDNKRLVFVKGRFFIWKGIEVFADVEITTPLPVSNKNLYAEDHGDIILDRFDHELNLAIYEQDKNYLLTGCAHNGIMNIMEHFKNIKGVMPDFVIGGFHLKSQTFGYSNQDTLITDLSEYMKTSQAIFYTCHCTGRQAFDILEDELKDKIHYLSTGQEININ